MGQPVATSPRPWTVLDDPPRTGTGGRLRDGRLLLLACIAVVLVCYTTSALLFARGGSGSDFHRRQAAALAEGHLDIRPVPDALTSLRDPYDAGENIDVRTRGGVQDLAFRNGRLYSAHGLTVPLLLLPSEIAFGTAPPNWVITLTGGWVGVLAGSWILIQLRRRFVPQVPDRTLAGLILAFGLCGPVWMLMSVGHGYEAASAVAFALTTSGAALLLRSVASWPSIDRPRAMLGSVLLALAVGARPTAVVGSIAIAVIATAVVRAARRPAADRTVRSRSAGDLAALLGPYAIVAVAIAWANIARFGAATEFGFGFQLTGWNMRTYPMGRPSYLAPNLWDYLAAAPRRADTFPWLRPREGIEGLRPEVHTAEPVVGLGYLAPVLLLGFTGLVATFRSMRRQAPMLAVATVTAAALGCAALLAVSFPFNTSSMRYAVDGAPMLLLAACASWCWVRGRPADRDRTRLLDLAWLSALAFGVVVTALTQITT